MTTPHAAAPDSLESVLNSLQNLLDSNRHRPSHSLINQSMPAISESFNNQPTEQYDAPLDLETSVTEMLQQHIPVLNDVIGEQADELSPQPISEAQIEKTLNELRTELSGIVAEIMLETREHLEKQETPSQEIIETSLKHFLDELSTLRTR